MLMLVICKWLTMQLTVRGVASGQTGLSRFAVGVSSCAQAVKSCVVPETSCFSVVEESDIPESLKGLILDDIF